MKQPARHTAPLQNDPVPHGVPSLWPACVHTPVASHASTVHGLPSLVHAVPAAFGVVVQPPAPLHVDVASHTPGVQVYAAPPHTPPVQWSFCVQLTLSLHAVPSVALDHADVDAAGAQTWHALR